MRMPVSSSFASTSISGRSMSVYRRSSSGSPRRSSPSASQSLRAPSTSAAAAAPVSSTGSSGSGVAFFPFPVRSQSSFKSGSSQEMRSRAVCTSEWSRPVGSRRYEAMRESVPNPDRFTPARRQASTSRFRSWPSLTSVASSSSGLSSGIALLASSPAGANKAPEPPPPGGRWPRGT